MLPQHDNFYPIKELNLVMDNCSLQNKNLMIIRSGAYMVELGWFRKINLIFLIKGHTKNDCNHMFNLFNMDWRKTNVYTIDKYMEILQRKDNVDVVKDKDLFFDYDCYFDLFYKKPKSGSVKNNHIFTFSKDVNRNFHTSITMTTKVSDNVETVKKQYLLYINDIFLSERARYDHLTSTQTTKLDDPGISPMKQVQMYTMWRPIVPIEFRDEISPRPIDEIISSMKKPLHKKKYKLPTEKQTKQTKTKVFDVISRFPLDRTRVIRKMKEKNASSIEQFLKKK